MAFRKNKNPDIMLKKQAQLSQYMLPCSSGRRIMGGAHG